MICGGVQNPDEPDEFGNIPDTLGQKFSKTFVPIKNDATFKALLDKKNQTIKKLRVASIN